VLFLALTNGGISFAGSVKPTASPPKITLSDEATLLGAYNSQFTLTGMSETSFLAVFYQPAQTINEYYTAGPLQAVLATVSDDKTAVTFSKNVTLPSSVAAYTLSATSLDSNTAVVAYADLNQNFGIMSQVIELESLNPADATEIDIGKCSISY
jgi:hypothetical protein